MKKIINEFISIIFGFVSLMALALGSYLLFTTLFHQQYLDTKLSFTEEYEIFQNYKENLDKIKKNIDSYNYDSNIFNEKMEKMNIYRDRINTCYKYLTDEESLIKLKTGDMISDYDIYVLNEFFNEKIVDECWVKSLSDYYYNSDNYQGYFKYFMKGNSDYISNIASQSTYLKKELKSNYNVHYINDNSLITSRNELLEHLNLLMSIYNNTSKLVYNMSNYLVDGDKLVIHNE